MTRLGIAILLALGLWAHAATAFAQSTSYPLWDGKQSIEDYARSVNLPSTKSLILSGGVKLDLVLIPAGEFVMGTPAPAVPNEPIQTGRWIEGVGAALTLGLTLLLAMRAAFSRGGANFSLRWLLCYVTTLSVTLHGAMRWRMTEQAWLDYKAAFERYDKGGDCEKPAHHMTLRTPFYMGKFPVTLKQLNSELADESIANLPVDFITSKNAEQFCKECNSLRRTGLRLPTDVEWEYACRAGTTTAYYSGDSERDLDRVAWYCANDNNTPHPVGLKIPNAFGLYDMHGNVWQWTVHVERLGDALGKCDYVRKGGARGEKAECCRSAHRESCSGYEQIGFRVVMDVTPEDRINETQR